MYFSNRASVYLCFISMHVLGSVYVSCVEESRSLGTCNVDICQTVLTVCMKLFSLQRVSTDE